MRRLEVVLVSVLCAGFAAAQLRSLDDPYVWDGLYYVAASARDVYLHPAGLIPDGPWDNGHPPLVYWLLAAAWLAAGPHLWVSHLLIIGFGATCILLTHALGRLLLGPRAGLLGAALLAVHPVFFYQAGTVNLNVPLAATTAACALAAVRGRWGLAAAAGGAMVLTHEIAAAYVPGIAACALWVRRRRDVGGRAEDRETLAPGSARREWAGAAALVAVPAAALGAWLVLHRAVAGWWFYVDVTRLPKLNLGLLSFGYELYRRTLRPFVREHGDWAAAALIAAAILVHAAARRRRGRTPEAEGLPVGVLYLAAVWAALILPQGMHLALTRIYLPRYILPALPFTCLLAAWAAVRLGRASGARLEPAVAGLAAAAAAAALLAAHDGAAQPGWESNRGYLEVMELHREAARRLEAEHRGARVLANWPTWQALCDPIYGYVSDPVTVVVIGNTPRFAAYCRPGAYVRIAPEDAYGLRPDEFDVVYVAPGEAASGAWDWARDRFGLAEVGRVERAGLAVTFLAPRGEGP